MNESGVFMELKYTITKAGIIHLRERGVTKSELAMIEARFNVTSVKETASYMCKSRSAVNFHMANIYKRLGVKCVHSFVLYMIPYVELVTTESKLEFKDAPEPEFSLPRSRTAPLLS